MTSQTTRRSPATRASAAGAVSSARAASARRSVGRLAMPSASTFRGGPITGRRSDWARDVGLAGGLAMATLLIVSRWLLAGAPLLETVVEAATKPEALVLSLGAAASGAVLGALTPGFLEWSRTRLRLRTVAALAPLAGAMWGLGVFAIGCAFLGWPGGDSLEAATFFAAVHSLLFGLVWFPYTFQTVMGGRRWPWIAVSPALILPASLVVMVALGLI